MSEHDHAVLAKPEAKPTHDEVAKKAYAIYLKEGRPQGHADQNWADTEAQLRHADAGQPGPPEHKDGHQGHQDHQDHHAPWQQISASGSGFHWS